MTFGPWGRLLSYSDMVLLSRQQVSACCAPPADCAGNSTNTANFPAAKGRVRPLQHRGNHVASLLAYRQPETLAEQLLAQQEHNNELQEQLVRGIRHSRCI
jgi:hypothetical protein